MTICGFLRLLLRVGLAVVFLWSGAAKLFTPQIFADGISGFQFFPPQTVNLIALVAPMLEIFAALLLLSPFWWRQGALLAALLSLVFAVLFGWAGAQGLVVSCSCFGNASTEISPLAGGGRALGLLAVGSWIYLSGILAEKARAGTAPKGRSGTAGPPANLCQ